MTKTEQILFDALNTIANRAFVFDIDAKVAKEAMAAFEAEKAKTPEYTDLLPLYYWFSDYHRVQPTVPGCIQIMDKMRDDQVKWEIERRRVRVSDAVNFTPHEIMKASGFTIQHVENPALTTYTGTRTEIAKVVSLALAQEQMGTDQEPKYGITQNRLYVRATGEFIPLDEPIFIFRAQDRKAANAIGNYCNDPEMGAFHKDRVHRRYKDFSSFATRYPERMKVPDTQAT